MLQSCTLIVSNCRVRNKNYKNSWKSWKQVFVTWWFESTRLGASEMKLDATDVGAAKSIHCLVDCATEFFTIERKMHAEATLKFEKDCWEVLLGQRRSDCSQDNLLENVWEWHCLEEGLWAARNVAYWEERIECVFSKRFEARGRLRNRKNIYYWWSFRHCKAQKSCQIASEERVWTIEFEGRDKI